MSITILFIKTNKNKSCNLNVLTCKLNIVKCSRNFEFEKRTDQNFITQNLSRIGLSYFEEKETVETMSKGGYI